MIMNRNLEIFIKVAECGSITRVAKMLYITQPAVSNAISKLETELNIKLFFRDKRNGLLLTHVGQKIYLLAKQMEDLDNRIAQTAYRENHFMEGRLRIAALTSLVSTILSKALKDYRKAFPGVTVEIREGSPNDIFRMVEEHTVDFAVSCSPFGKFDSITLRRDRMAAMLPEEAPDILEVDLTAPPALLIINKPAYETILDHVKQPFPVEQFLQVQTAETAINMVLDGNGIGILSEYTMDTLVAGHRKYPVKPEIAFDIGIFARDLEDLTPAALEFVHLITQRLTAAPTASENSRT
ncbi:MAG TPA: LysR family transcriptional regulator [Candidatus Egerieimonas intestinavium]|uniref:LysR family transcriptional regulator n=1 Tax=Candidatus Egerieimonas intestinavium TaxID=2840777 RepID=A0A9D1EHL4_9FIRM|nr:LysR family transcriptional regulator [Candidatus Egerieimonas intestinavium]